jgi:hypothetical protein
MIETKATMIETKATTIEMKATTIEMKVTTKRKHHRVTFVVGAAVFRVKQGHTLVLNIRGISL